LPKTAEAQILGKQLLRSGTSVGANYRAAGRSRSKAEFIARVGIVVEEADETVFWLELLHEGGIVKAERLQELMQEANELAAIFASAHQTAKGSR
jgi:four helix bundle protein